MFPSQLSMPSTTAGVARVLAYLLLVAAGLGLLRYLRTFARRVLAEPYRDRWRYLAVGVGAAVVYGAAGLLESAGLAPAVAFRRGATLFFFLFCAVGLRAVHRSVGGDPLLPESWARYLGPAVVGGFVLAWWSAYLLGLGSAVAVLELAGLLLAVAYTLYHAVGTVRAQEGTSVAAFTRQFVPALLAFAALAAAGHVDVVAPAAATVAEGVALVATVLAGAFLFTTAVALRQQTVEVSRMYDPTTWRSATVGGRDYDPDREPGVGEPDD
jgi:hypothetical protein